MPRQWTPTEPPTTVNCRTLFQSIGNFRLTWLNCFPHEQYHIPVSPICSSAGSFGSPVRPSVKSSLLAGRRRPRDSCPNETLLSLWPLEGRRPLTIRSVPWVTLFTFGIDPEHCWHTGLRNEYVCVCVGGGVLSWKRAKTISIHVLWVSVLCIFQIQIKMLREPSWREKIYIYLKG